MASITDQIWKWHYLCIDNTSTRNQLIFLFSLPCFIGGQLYILGQILRLPTSYTTPFGNVWTYWMIWMLLWITLCQTVHPQTAYLLPCCFQGIPAIPVGSSRKFTSTSIGCASSKMHVFKKIRNNIESSKCIVWEHLEECFKFNFQNGFFYTQQTYGGAHQFNPFK